MAEEFLRGVYDLDSQDATNDYYTAWAATYDEELTRQGYRSPQRCAEALARFVEPDAPILDVGCGTGLSGVALRTAGFSDVSGQEINDEMLALAIEAGVYRTTWIADPADPFPFEAGTFAALAAIGVIGIGAAPASLLTESLHALAPGGHLVFSYNDHALEHPEFSGALEDAITAGLGELVHSEHGPHFEGLGSSSTVYVLRRLGA
jgi:predicted TPR repeat methyltransferase